MNDDPYNDFKKYHKAKLMNHNGGVSPECAVQPRALNLERELWTTDDKAVTCVGCLAAMGVANPKAEAKSRRRKQMAAVLGDVAPGGAER